MRVRVPSPRLNHHKTRIKSAPLSKVRFLPFKSCEGSSPSRGTMYDTLKAYERFAQDKAPDCEIGVTGASPTEFDAEFMALQENYHTITNEKGEILVRLAPNRYHRMIPIPGHDGIKPFAIGKYPFTNGDWIVATEKQPPQQGRAYDKPVVSISATEAEEILKKYKLRLPSDPEWQLAAYGIDGRTYPWGEDPPTNERMIWSGSGIRRSGPECVGRCRAGASPFEVEDMLGNVWEWTSTSEDRYRVLRGGSWYHYVPSRVRAGFRGWNTMTIRNNNVGFRCAMDL